MDFENTIISHVRQSDMAIQSNDEHQHGVAELASKFAGEFGMAEWGRVMGLLHDKGKEKRAFQQHIMKESGLDRQTSVDGDYRHAYVGALIAKELFPNSHLLMDNALMGHHRGMYDDGDWKEIMKSQIPEDVSIDGIQADLIVPRLANPKKDVHHLERMLYSCLVDADFLDTEAFMQPEQSRLRGNHDSLATLEKRLEAFLAGLKKYAPDTEVNRIRNEVQNWCVKESVNPPDFYSLTVPTGGGKTLASVLWAIKHAIKNDLKRIIIAIPYTSIITQTASVLRNIFGEKNVLEHHSNVDRSAFDDRELAQKLKLATENWDYPIIVTTNVQLFESLFSNKPSDCRKLHSIAKSVLILDEVQTLPTDFLQPIVDTFDTLKRVFGVSVLFTTASQPVLSGLIQGTNPFVSFEGLSNIREIIPEGANLYDRLRRVELKFEKNPKNYDEVANELSHHSRVLCIVNTRNDAREIYTRLPKEGICLHLSRMMCPDHVMETIDNVKLALKESSNTTIRVVATQLIEAGVDIDFPMVFRQEAGLDSVLQAAGRCNREGKLGIGSTVVFGLQKPLPPGHIRQTNDARLAIMNREYDWFSPEAMEAYFKQLYSRVNSFDKKNIKDLLYKAEIQFETAASAFHLIDDNTISVIVNWKNSMELVERLVREGPSYSLMKALSQFSVNVRNGDMKKLVEAGAIEEVLEGIYVIRDQSFYSNEVGLVTDNHWLEESLIV
ncbi:MAG: CRISPR-associated helicase Cas3' [Bacteroidales bacterium]|nr:CRISPR-associated helicase Cas3' [Bacteroidales bacterium]MBR4647042.1 CRISPR-associated helicase Cas3' [Bacteroidales bacterium]